MIAVKMCDADHINRLEAPPLLPERDLGSHTTVDQKAGPSDAGDH
jgi:hypothetical protein